MKPLFLAVLSFVLFLSGSLVSSAQDIVVKKDNSKISAIVQEINTQNVIYKNFDNPTGPNYVVPITDLVKIRFENGTEQVFQNSIFDNSPSQFDGGQIEYSRGDFYSQGRKLTQSELSTILTKDSFETYSTATKQRSVGKGLLVGGLITIGASVGSVILAAILYSNDSSCEYVGNDGMYYHDSCGDSDLEATADLLLFSANVGVIVGTGLVSAGIPLLSIGNGRLNWVAEDYNDNYSAQLTFGTQRNGIGFALNF